MRKLKGPVQVIVPCSDKSHFWLNVSGFRSENKNDIDFKLELLVNRLFQQQGISPLILSVMLFLNFDST